MFSSQNYTWAKLPKEPPGLGLPPQGFGCRHPPSLLCSQRWRKANACPRASCMKAKGLSLRSQTMSNYRVINEMEIHF